MQHKTQHKTQQSNAQNPPLSPTAASLLTSFHQKVSIYNQLAMHNTAIFYADKAASISPTPLNLITQARLYFSIAQYRTALHILQSNHLPSHHQTATLLAAQCYFQLNDYDACLALLGDEQPVDTAISALTLRGAPRELHAALCVLRAQVHQRLENPHCALMWYKRAFRCDIFCVEAFHALSNAGLIPKPEAADYVRHALSDAPSPPQTHALATKWITSYYAASTHKNASVPASPPMNANVDLTIVHALRAFDALDFATCLEHCRAILHNHPHQSTILPVYLATLVELDEHHELFITAHDLVDNAPKSPISWLAVGYYYVACGKPELARRFFRKCTAMDMQIPQAWIAIGHAFAAQDESDQAMAAYRTAARLFPGLHQPQLFMGMEYVRQGSLSQAVTMLQHSAEASKSDPAPIHELGVIAYRMGDYQNAANYFRTALQRWQASDASRDLCGQSGRRAEAEEATLVNLGHCYRRLEDYERAKQCYQKALGLRPRSASTCGALGMTLHAMCDLDGAIAMYHRALRSNPENVVFSHLLERALQDMLLMKPTGNIILSEPSAAMSL